MRFIAALCALILTSTVLLAASTPAGRSPLHVGSRGEVSGIAAPTPVPTPTPTPRPTPVPLTMFPFALPPFDDSKTATDVSWMDAAPAGSSGFLKAQGEHLVDGNGHIVRLWGINISFGGVFPDKADAPRIAARLAKFGFNAVRIHCYDEYPAPDGLYERKDIGSSHLKVPREIVPDQVDRMDFFLAELIKHGLYIDLNVHVGATLEEGEGIPDAAKLPDKDKGVSYFDPRIMQAQRDFAKQMLRHVNGYLGHAYKDEPGICAVEYSDEDSVLGMWEEGTLQIPPAEAAILDDGWNKWVQATYPNGGWRKEWTEESQAVDPNDIMSQPIPAGIMNPDSADGKFKIAAASLQRWKFVAAGDAAGAMDYSALGGPVLDGSEMPAMTCDLRTDANEDWAYQMNRDGLDLKDGQLYTLSFWARGDKARRISVNVWQDIEPHRFCDFTGYLDIGTQWQQYSLTLRAQNTEPEHSRLNFSLGKQKGQFQMSQVALQEGGSVGPPPDWTPGNLPLLTYATTPVFNMRRDFARFLGQMESDQVARTREYLIQELGVRCPMWHSQAMMGGWGGIAREVQSDVISVHGYWRHPDLGPDGWKDNTWTIDNSSMTKVPGDDPLSTFGLFRVQGKPLVMGEWNDGQPNDFGAEVLLSAAAYASWQDWAGVFTFDYHSDGPYDRDYFEGFFSIDGHPVKMATAPAAALLFRRPVGVAGTMGAAGAGADAAGDLPRAQDSVTLTLPMDGAWNEIAALATEPSAIPVIRTWAKAGAAPAPGLSARTYVRFGHVAAPIITQSFASNDALPSSGPPTFAWRKDPGVLSVNAADTKMAVGFLGGYSLQLGELNLAMPLSQTNFAAYALSSLDGAPTATSKHLLLTAAGKAENIDMGWNAAHTSVGSHWGHGPTHVEGIVAAVEMVTNAPTLHVWALDNTGARRAEVPCSLTNGVLRFTIGPEWATLWYEIGTG